MSWAEQSREQGSGFRKAFGGTLYWLGMASGGASLFVLIQEGYHLGVAAPPLHDIVATYNSLVHAIGEVVKPFFITLLDSLARFGWERHLLPDWKHIAVSYGAMGAAIARMTAKTWIDHVARFLAIPIIMTTGLLLSGVGTKETVELFRPGHLAWIAPLMAGMMLVIGTLVLVFPNARLSSRARESQHSLARSFVMLPLAVIFFLVTNAGLQAVSN